MFVPPLERKLMLTVDATWETLVSPPASGPGLSNSPQPRITVGELGLSPHKRVDTTKTGSQCLGGEGQDIEELWLLPVVGMARTDAFPALLH